MSILPERSAGLKHGLEYRARLLTRRSIARRVGLCSFSGALKCASGGEALADGDLKTAATSALRARPPWQASQGRFLLDLKYFV